MIANKPAGVPIQPDLTGDVSLLAHLEEACQQPLFLINRLDRPVSGLVVFAKTKSDAAHLNEQFSTRKVEKTYLAAVKTAPQPPEALLTHYIQKQKNEQNASKAFAKPAANTEKAALSYATIGSTAIYTFLKITLHTGRHHQIRAQLAAIGSPIKGDVKYGARRANADRSIHLHSWRTELTHPKTGARMTFFAPLPNETLWSAITAFIPFG